MSVERSLIHLVLAKAESTYGTDPVPTGANVIAIVRNSFKYVPKWQHVIRQIADGTFRKVSGLNVLPEVDLSFSVELRGNRTDGIAADISGGLSANAIEIDSLLQACDLAPTYTVGAGVIYKPTIPTDSGKGVTFYFHTQGKRHIVTGCKGTFKINMQAGQFGMIDFTFKGLYNAPTDVALSTVTPTWLNTLPPVFVSSGSTVDSFSPVFQKFDLDLGAKIDKREDANSAFGTIGFLITDRQSKCMIDPESITEATATLWADLAGGQTRTITAKIGTQAGNKIQITVVGVSEDVSYGDRGGIRTQPISYSVEQALLSDAVGGELQIKFY